MEEIVNLIAADEAASDISDKIKDVLYTKAAQRVDNYKPNVSSSMFSDTEQQPSEDQE
tara:strand:- start:105 stop:278 length:174 start_codon:yes stop_codon:yes gene_type:complete